MAQHSLVLKVYRTFSLKFPIALCTLATVGASKLFASEFAFVRPTPRSFHSLVDLEASLELEMLRYDLRNSFRMSCGGQWRTCVKRIAAIWKVALGGSLLLLPLSIGFLQIDRIEADLQARTLTLTAFVFASGGLTSGSVLVIISATGKLDGDRCARKWKEACQHPNLLSSLDFWACLALPVSSVLWSLLFSIGVVCVFAFTPTSEGATDGSAKHGLNVADRIGAAVFSIAIVVQLTLLSRLFRLVGGACDVFARHRG